MSNKIYDMTDVWNDVNQSFTSIKMNANNVNSKSDSKLIDLQVNDESKLSLEAKTGKLTVNGSIVTDKVTTPQFSLDESNLILGPRLKITAEGSVGPQGYVLTSSGTAGGSYWSPPTISVTNVANGSISGINSALSILNYENVELTQVPVYHSSAGRFTRNALGQWVKSSVDDQQLFYYDSLGTIVGIDMSPADTYYSAPWDTANNSTSNSVFLRITNTVTSNVQYANTHSEPSIFDGSGKGTVLNLGTYIFNNVAVANNIQVATTGGDLIRLEMIFGLKGNENVTTNTRILIDKTIVANTGTAFRTWPIDINFGNTNTIQSVSCRARRFDYTKLQTVGGVDFYFAWCEELVPAGNNVTFAPNVTWTPGTANSTPTANGRKLLIQDFRLIKNGSTVPNAAPVCANNKTFTSSYFDFGTSTAIDVKFNRLRKGKTRVTNDRIEPIRTYRSRPSNDSYLHYESEILISPSEEINSNEFILPNYYQKLDMVPLANNENVQVYFGDYYYNENYTVGDISKNNQVPTDNANTGFYGAANSISFLGAFSSPKKWAQISSVFVNTSTVRGNFTLNNVNVFKRATTYGQQLGQSFDLHSNIQVGGDNITISNSCFSGHTQHHARLNTRVYYNESANSAECRWHGYCNFGSNNLITITNTTFNRMARAIQIDYGNNLYKTQNVNFDGIRGEKIWSDFIYFVRGTFSGTIKNIIRHKPTFTYTDDYHSRDEVMIDRGNGLEYLSNTGLTIDDLPTNRQMYLYSCRPSVGSPIDTSSDTVFKWTTQSRNVRYMPYHRQNSTHEGYQATFDLETLPDGVRVQAGIPGPLFVSYFDAINAAFFDGAMPDDSFCYVCAIDTGTHTDPYTGQTVKNQGVFKKVRGYADLIRIADAWPFNSGFTYANTAARNAAIPSPSTPVRGPGLGSSITTCIIDVTDPVPGNAGVYEYANSSLGWVKIANNITLPVYASTPGKPSANNPHIYVTLDHIAYSLSSYVPDTTGNVPSSTYRTLTKSAVAYGSSSTHQDFFQIPMKGAIDVNNLSMENIIQYDTGQFIFTQGSDNIPVNSSNLTARIKNFSVNNAICIIEQFNALYIANSYLYSSNTTNPLDPSATRYTQNFKNILVLPAGDYGGAVRNFNGELQSPFMNGPRSGLQPGQISVNNVWFATNNNRSPVAGNTAKLSANVNIIYSANSLWYYNYYPVSSASNTTMDQAVNTDYLTTDAWRMKYNINPKKLKWNDFIQKKTGIPLNDIWANVITKPIFSNKMDEMIQWLEDNFQREPDLSLTVSSSANVGDVIATGVSGNRWHPNWGGGEDELFKLDSGVITVNRPLANFGGYVSRILSLPINGGYSNSDIIVIRDDNAGSSNAVISFTTDSTGKILSVSNVRIEIVGSGFTRSAYAPTTVPSWGYTAATFDLEDSTYYYSSGASGNSTPSSTANTYFDGIERISINNATGVGYNNNDIIVITSPNGANCTASIETNSIGKITKDPLIIDRGSGFPARQQFSGGAAETTIINMANSTGGTATGNKNTTGIIAIAGGFVAQARTGQKKMYVTDNMSLIDIDLT